LTAGSVLARAGFAGEALDKMKAISYGECRKHTPAGAPLQGYYDAVGDWEKITPTPAGETRDPTWDAYDPVSAAKWKASLNFCQIRCLVDPNAWSVEDRVRVAEKIHLDPDECARAAWVISRGGTHLTPWSVFNSGAYLQWMTPGFDYKLVLGHPEAHRWNT
jgi:hypothetical protein